MSQDVRFARVINARPGVVFPARVPALVGHLHAAVVDLDTVDSTRPRSGIAGYTRRSQTSNGCQRSTWPNDLISWHIHRLPTAPVNP